MADSIPVDAVPEAIGAPPLVCRALLNSGLLGFTKDGAVLAESVEQYKKYLTQWREDLPPRRYPVDRIPVPQGLAGGEQPVLTQTQMQIAAGRPPSDAESDVGWIAHFYLRPNQFFFPSPTELALVGPVPVKLTKRMKARYGSLPVSVCPDPNGRLALVVVEGPPGTEGDPFDTSYEAAQAVLREIAFAADVPLPIAQTLVIGVPSGVITLQFSKPAKEVDFEALGLNLAEPVHIELEEAKALYWEALSTSNPFHRFLSFWRIYERVTSARGKWRKHHKRADTRVAPERMPEMWAWAELSGRTFEEVRQSLDGPYRDALAHADGKRSTPRTPLRAKDISEVAGRVPVVQFIARTVIRNFEATLNS